MSDFVADRDFLELSGFRPIIGHHQTPDGSFDETVSKLYAKPRLVFTVKRVDPHCYSSLYLDSCISLTFKPATSEPTSIVPIAMDLSASSVRLFSSPLSDDAYVLVS